MTSQPESDALGEFKWAQTYMDLTQDDPKPVLWDTPSQCRSLFLLLTDVTRKVDLAGGGSVSVEIKKVVEKPVKTRVLYTFQ